MYQGMDQICIPGSLTDGKGPLPYGILIPMHRPPGSILQSGILNRPLFHAVLIILLGLMIYSNTFHVPFQFDDLPVIKQSASLPETFSLSAFLEGNRSIGYLSFALNYAVHGLSVEGYHFVNIAIHLTNALLLYILVIVSFITPVLRDTVPKDRERAIALVSSLLFVCHPVQTQAVTYIVQRFTSLAAMFYLLSLILYVKARTLSRPAIYVLSLLCAVLAMKTKEIAFTLPFVIALYEAMFFRGAGWKRFLSPYGVQGCGHLSEASLIAGQSEP
jgi:protein O-mannosyl-transferase